MSDSPGLVDFVIGRVNSPLNLPDKQMKFSVGIQITEDSTVRQILLFKFIILVNSSGSKAVL